MNARTGAIQYKPVATSTARIGSANLFEVLESTESAFDATQGPASAVDFASWSLQAWHAGWVRALCEPGRQYKLSLDLCILGELLGGRISSGCIRTQVCRTAQASARVTF